MKRPERRSTKLSGLTSILITPSSLIPSAFNVSSKGIAAGLNNLQKLEDGEMLAGGSTTEEDFGGDNAVQDDDMM